MAKTITVVTVNDDFASIALFVGRDLITIKSLVSGSVNLHNIKAKPSMVMKVKKADLLLRLGMSQDTWLDGVITVARNSLVMNGQPGYLDCSDAIDKLEVPTGKLDGRLGDVHIEGNPHYWLNPKNGAVIAKQICDRLIVLDPDHRDIYLKNYQEFVDELNQKILGWKQRMKLVSDTPFVTYHKVWSYFFDFFELDLLGQLEPLPGVPPSIRHLSALKSKLSSQNQAAIVLTADFYSNKVTRSFAEMVDARYVSVKCNVTNFKKQSYFDLFDNIISQVVQ